MNLAKDFQGIDANNLGSAPLTVRVTIFVAVIAAVLGLAYKLDVSELQTQLEVERGKEQDLKNKVVEKQQLSANLEAYQTQLVEMEQTFSTLLRQLPGKKEVEDLIVDVAQTSLADGLKNIQIQAQPEEKKGFYAVAPYTLRFQGTYHQLAKFVSDASALPRIITLHNFATITPSGDFDKSKELDLKITARTYRYLEEDEIEKAPPAKPAAGAKKTKG